MTISGINYKIIDDFPQIMADFDMQSIQHINKFVFTTSLQLKLKFALLLRVNNYTYLCHLFFLYFI